MANIKSRQDLIDAGYKILRGSDGGIYAADTSYFLTRVQRSDPAHWKEFVATLRDSGRDVSQVPLWRRLSNTVDYYHINSYRYRPTLRKGIYIPFYGPNLQTVIHDQQTTRKRNNKTGNYSILNRMYNGDEKKDMCCMVCNQALVNQRVNGFVIPYSGDLHHVVVWHNRSLNKEGEDPSKKLEACKLDNGKSPVSKANLLDFMQTVPLCKHCHHQYHVMFRARNPITKHSDLRDYQHCQYPYFMRSSENYYEFLDFMESEYNYSDLPSYEEWMERLHLPESLHPSKQL